MASPSKDVPQTPITPANQEAAMAVINEMIDLCNKEPNPEQKGAIAQFFHKFAVGVLRRTGQEAIAPPDFGAQKKRKSKKSNNPDDPFNDEMEDEEGNSDTTSSSATTDEEEDGEGSLADVNFKARKGGKNKKKESKIKDMVKLMPVDFALSEEYNVEVVQQARDKFHNLLQKFELTITKNNKEIDVRFSAKEATVVTNFFFSDVLGKSLRTRLSTIMTYYNSHVDEGIPVGAGRTAQILSTNENNPLSLRQFYSSFAVAHRQRLSHATQWATWMKHVRSLQLYTAYISLHADAVKKEPTLVEFLTQAGMSPSRGRDYRTLVNEHICAALHIESVHILQNTTQAAQGIAALVEHFGDGIIVMLPSGAENKLNRFGNQKMQPAYKLLDIILPNLQPICDLVHKRLHLPMMRGEPLTLIMRANTKLSLEELLDSDAATVEDTMEE